MWEKFNTGYIKRHTRITNLSQVCVDVKILFQKQNFTPPQPELVAE